jgi:uncharacterized membrane protein
MRTYLKLFCLALPISIALDASWIGVIASGFYQSEFGTFFRPDPNFFAGAAFYVLYALALIYFVLKPALEERSLVRAVISGAILGFTAYMTYDLTNMATLVGWPLLGAFVDTCWGTLMTALTSGLTYVVATKVFKM